MEFDHVTNWYLDPERYIKMIPHFLRNYKSKTGQSWTSGYTRDGINQGPIKSKRPLSISHYPYESYFQVRLTEKSTVNISVYKLKNGLTNGMKHISDCIWPEGCTGKLDRCVPTVKAECCLID
jgi:hypothetical protein